MASAAFPSVISAVVSMAQQAIPTLFDRVIRGRDISDDPSDAVLIGILGNELDDDGDVTAGAFQQTMQSFGGNREEIGQVNGLVVAWNGEANQDAACSTAFDYIAGLETALRADRTLGLTFEYTVAEFQAGDVMESQNDSGARTVLSFVIAYKVRI